MTAVLIAPFLIYFLIKIIKENRLEEKYKEECELDSATLIKYDKHSVKHYGILTGIAVVCFGFAWMYLEPIGIESRVNVVLFMSALLVLFLGGVATIWGTIHWINGIFYLKRLEKQGYEVPENRKEYMILERLPKRDTEPRVEEKGYHKGSKVLACLTILVAAIMLVFSVYYFCKWWFIEFSPVFLIIQLFADALWLLPISMFRKQMDLQKYKDDVEVDITRNTRMNGVSGTLLLIVLILAAFYVKSYCYNWTRCEFEIRLEIDGNRLEEIHDALEPACFEMILFYSAYPGWAELEESMRAGVDITTWGTPKGYFQEQVADTLGISDFNELQEEFLSTNGQVGVYVKLEDNNIIVELRNVYPAAEKELIVR